MILLFLSHGLIKVSSLGIYLLSAYLANKLFSGNEECSEQEILQDDDETLNRRNINRWLKIKKIEPIKMGREVYVHKLLVDFELQKEICLNLRRMYPNNWFEIFMSGTNDPEIIAMIKEHFDYVDSDVGEEKRHTGVKGRKREIKHFKNF
jgi:hypothetical protein